MQIVSDGQKVHQDKIINRIDYLIHTIYIPN